MLVLAIDTTARTGGFALARDGEVVASRTLEADRGLAAALFGEVEALLAEAGCSLADVDAFAALAGPGSFTGIRVGLSAVKALAEAGGKPVLALSNLEAAAFERTGDLRAVLLPGRRGDVFGAVFDGELRPLVSERQEPEESFRARVRALGAEPEVVEGPRAEAAAKLAGLRLAEGAAGAPEAAEANYVERAAVEKG
ncbi:MAG: tRNA (adenosine(37)-N6)-threonylcarbamoyltransferase complex dimerization subunit type 1 TsaB [Bryobacterales bacterium]|nr:tRNA (adenosine(37)-N6)-threonylcarbamoyltransferase complex dimerization subunit type 1 TsaB [Bryobacterales bacterium]